MFNKEDFNRFLGFLPGHLLSTMFWWLPLLILACLKSYIIVLIFLGIFVSYTFGEWKRFDRAKKLRIFQVHWLIEAGYILSTSVFLFLTGKFVYDGLMSNYVTHARQEWFWIALYAAAITVCLATITYMIKTGRQWVSLALLFLLFDLPGAMPFNFLHFYENQKIQNRLDLDKVLVEKVQLDCEQIISPILGSAQKDLDVVHKTQNAKANQIDQQLKTNSRITEYANRSYRGIEDIKGQAGVAARKGVRGSFSTAKLPTIGIDTASNSRVGRDSANLRQYLPLNHQLDATTNLLQKEKKTADREMQLSEIEDIKSRLKMVCSTLKDPVLLQDAANLVPNAPTQLQSISAVYSYIGQQLFSLQSDEEMDKATQKLILMSLIPSIIIDILPLLFAIFYARWRSARNE